MCGVIGYHSAAYTESDRDLLIGLFDESVVRGRHAYGFAAIAPYIASGCVLHNRSRTLAPVMHFLLDAAEIGKPLTLIGHARYSTSGDYEDPENNQPIVDGVALAFNGVIDMGTREEMERRHGVKLKRDNDGDVFVQKLLRGDDVEAWVRYGAFSFAGVYLRSGKLYALRNERRPLWWAMRGRSKFVASTLDIMKRAGVADGADAIEQIVPGAIGCLTT